VKPNVYAMVRAKIQVDADLNDILALLVGPDDAPLEDGSMANALVRAKIGFARRALDRFEDAARGS
jgi:hypothetical protein